MNTPSYKERWEDSFQEQIASRAYNTAPAEAVVRPVAYYLRGRFPSGDYSGLHFLELGCGAGPNLLWLAQKGIRVSGIDISPRALALAVKTLEGAGYRDRIGTLREASVTEAPFADESFDGIIESCVFQHLSKPDRERAFAEVRRLLKPGGIFTGYMIDASSNSVYQAKRAEELADDPGTLMLYDEGRSKFYLTNIGLSHFFQKDEFDRLLAGFSIIDPCLVTYYLPREEARRRGYEEYLLSLWSVYAVK